MTFLPLKQCERLHAVIKAMKADDRVKEVHGVTISEHNDAIYVVNLEMKGKRWANYAVVEYRTKAPLVLSWHEHKPVFAFGHMEG